MYLHNKTNLKDLRRKLRHNQTDAEKKVWNLLRNRQMQGLKFFRQYSVGHYVLDFYCPELKLAIELDGGQHNFPEEAESDADRTEKLKQNSIRVLRFWNNDVMKNIEGVYNEIIKYINSSRPPL